MAHDTFYEKLIKSPRTDTGWTDSSDTTVDAQKAQAQAEAQAQRPAKGRSKWAGCGCGLRIPRLRLPKWPIMGRFGFGSKAAEADQDPNRSGLFGRKKSSQSTQSSRNENPYASAPITPYQEARARLNSGQRPGVGLPSGPDAGHASPPPPYASQLGTGYGNDRHGSSSGYGSNRYNDNTAAFQANRQVPSVHSSAWSTKSGTPSVSRGSGGYGGFGPANDTAAINEKRQDLFDAAPSRATQPINHSQLQAREEPGASGASFDGYGAPRELTTEEREEQEVSSIKKETQDVRELSLQSTERSIRAGHQAQATMRATLAQLHVQDERLHNTEMNLDIAATHNRRAEEKTKELSHLNRSMLAISIANPFTSKARQEAQYQKTLHDHQVEREVRGTTRQAAYQANQLAEESFKELESEQRRRIAFAPKQSTGQSKFLFKEEGDKDDHSEGDGENGDNDMTEYQAAKKAEEKLDEDQREIGFIADDLLRGARMQGVVLTRQNATIDRITYKSDAVDDQIRMNRAKLDRAVR